MTALAPATRSDQPAAFAQQNTGGEHRTSAASRPAADLLHGAKFAYTTRFVAEHLAGQRAAGEPTAVRLVKHDQIVPRPGDVIVAEVVETGQHTRLESPHGRRQTMYVGDRIVVAYGHRYAPDQFEAVVPLDLGDTNLVAAGGVAGEVISQHAQTDPATVIRPLGLLHDDQGRWTLERFAPHSAATPGSVAGAAVPTGTPAGPAVVLSIGSTMNSGKTTTAACLIRGLTAAGLHVTAGKATGTGAGRDPMLFVDSGATRVLDFTDFGHATTSRLNVDQVLELTTSMITELASDTAAGRPDVVVVEIADGLLQTETSAVLQHPELQQRVDGVVFASGESLGAIQGHGLLDQWGFRVAAVSGVVTSSPLAAREAAAQLPVPVIDTFELCLPERAIEVGQRLGRQFDRAGAPVAQRASA